MEKIKMGEHVFQVVDFVPYGYMIWNIGPGHMPKGYLPLCRLSGVQPFEGGRNIDTESMKAIKTEGANLILEAARVGFTRAELKAFAEKHQNAEIGTYNRFAVERIKRAMPYLDAMDWHE